MPVTDLPEVLTGFPTTALGPGIPAFRIARARDVRTGEARPPWFFSSVPGSHPGRFDLPTPSGSCYFSDRRYGAWLEVFRATGLVDRADVERRRLITATRTETPLHLADLRAPGARRFGITHDSIAGDDYTQPQAWAARLHEAAFPGIAATARRDPTATARNLAIFGPAGGRTRVRGWHTASVPLVTDTGLMVELAPFGTGVAPRPYDVPVTPPP